MDNQVVGFYGRYHSGKTSFANLLAEEYGFKKISIADDLKDICAKLFNFNLSDFVDQYKKHALLNPIIQWNENWSQKLAQIVAISPDSLPVIKRDLKNRREIMQFVGTEILRRYDNDFHVKRLRKRIEALNCNVVIDDGRFGNELQCLNDLKAINIYIVRPYYYDCISNHVSEIQVNRSLTEYCLVNDSAIEVAKQNLRVFFNEIASGIEADNILQNYTVADVMSVLDYNRFDTRASSQDLGIQHTSLVKWINKNLILQNYHRQSIRHTFVNIDVATAYWAGVLYGIASFEKKDNRYIIKAGSENKDIIYKLAMFCDCDVSCDYDNNFYSIVIDNPFVIDDLKLWRVTPKEYPVSELPECVLQNDHLVTAWEDGVKDSVN